MEEIRIFCENDGAYHKVPMGTSLESLSDNTFRKVYDEKSGTDIPVLAALVDNRLKELEFPVMMPHTIRFIGYNHPDGRRTYVRSLCFVLQHAARDMYPDKTLHIEYSLPSGLYCELREQMANEDGILPVHFLTDEEIERIKERMQEIIDRALPIHRHEATTEEATEMFRKLGTHSKVTLLKTIGNIYTTYYEIDGYVDYFYGTMLTNTSQLHLFGLEKYYDGLLLRIPAADDPSKLGEMTRQDKMFEIFQEHHRWQNLVGIGTVGAFNEAVAHGRTNDIINVSEALQEKKISRIADEIAQRRGVKVVLISGPSSSGKTTTCKRLSIQLLTNGIKPVPISLDDYFVDRELTPKDEKGEYDYESLYALNLPLLNSQLGALFRGEEIELPKYNFQSGKSERSGRRMRLGENEILVMEGIHALNPELTAQIPEEHKFRVYASALTTILLDTHNYIPTTDNRLLRRIIRDYKYRGVSAQETIHRWPSVRAGENKWIFPYQENADAMFNTAMIYELAVIKGQAEPLLELVPENCDEYAEAYRLRKFLRYFTPVRYNTLPSTSLLREFLGGSSFRY